MLKGLASLALLALAAAGRPPHAGPYPVKEEVTALPGVRKLPSKMYSGFIDAGTPPSGVGTMYFHYWMVESMNDPANDPVIMWYNGGPGASSLFGLMQEFGPLLLDDSSFDEQWAKTGIPSPQPNPYSWALNATIVCLDSPPPIGFSFCTEHGPSGGGPTCGPWTDKSVFKANHAAHKTFFNDIFPELKQNPFFLAGESYAGIYVPGFVNEMLDDPVPGLNFRGFMVGDGIVGCPDVDGKPADWCVNLDNVGTFNYPNTNLGPWYDIKFFGGHAQFSNELYQTILDECPREDLLDWSKMTGQCKGYIGEMADEIGSFYVYNLYNNCPANDKHLGINRQKKAHRRIRHAVAGTYQKKFGSIARDPRSGESGFSTGECLGDAMPIYFARPEVLEALHLPADIAFVNLDNGHGFDYTTDQYDVRYIYGKALAANLTVLVYEGDTDACGLETGPIEDAFVSYFKELGLKKTKRWQPWTTDGQKQMAGYQVEWGNGKVRFVSVRGAGHLVPHNQPVVSKVLLDTFVCEATKGGCNLPPLNKTV
eukprot:TRINITY_DN27191_c0_g1_i1.p1 TRINITY_DN27191_c0_g1~~TRINITY_DN27191_c0_g1_i1.p1  ORF type:complete len:538 (+),score=236.05 TRINITY_DN27191_c0_g1_i1:50-1663(+)